MTAPVVSALELGEQVWAALDGITNLNAFRGRVDNPPLDDDGVVHAYAVLYEAPGHRSGSRLGSVADRFEGLFQVTCAGGDTVRALWCIDKVTRTLTGLRLEVPDRTKTVRILEDPSNRSRRVLPDEDVSPVRYFAPLLFNIQL